MDPNQDDMETQFIDKIGLSNTLEMLARICADKAEHLLENWQDKRGAAEWKKMARKLYTLAAITDL